MQKSNNPVANVISKGIQSVKDLANLVLNNGPDALNQTTQEFMQMLQKIGNGSSFFNGFKSGPAEQPSNLLSKMLDSLKSNGEDLMKNMKVIMNRYIVDMTARFKEANSTITDSIKNMTVGCLPSRLKDFQDLQTNFSAIATQCFTDGLSAVTNVSSKFTDRFTADSNALLAQTSVINDCFTLMTVDLVKAGSCYWNVSKTDSFRIF